RDDLHRERREVYRQRIRHRPPPAGALSRRERNAMNPPTSAPSRSGQTGPAQSYSGLGPASQGPHPGGWDPQPQRITHRRTAGDVAKGLGAFVALVVLLGAIPFALVRYIGWPLPHHMPTADMFNRPITP